MGSVTSEGRTVTGVSEPRELPTFLQHNSVAYDVMPDLQPATWGIWDRQGCIGEIRLDGESWVSQANHGAVPFGEFDTWQEAVVDLLVDRSPPEL